MRTDRLPIYRIAEFAAFPLARGTWPATLAPVAHVLEHGLDLGAATVFVGENGSGKSTLVEAIAIAYGLSPEGGSLGAEHSTRPTESELGQHLQLTRNPRTAPRGYFLRAETMHGFYTFLENNPPLSHRDIAFHDMSHGESFIELVASRFRGPGVWVLDEPESALSFSGCLSLLAMLENKLADGDSQVIMSTHSPILAALPGAAIYEVGPWGLRRQDWQQLGLVENWKSFLEAPARFLDHLGD
ncbi:ATP-binding cassette domain-containing protein [Glaciihabitans sp. dw_435]|uniref:AAA family ATPase n=1 Tax=Glaciihabitans sp. dw_435 TaxID=2720081 RepID=UPI001BD6BD37|nr:ATP-binding cassette domain-containing protein [Glaciihabitans sp. dw_435]